MSHRIAFISIGVSAGILAVIGLLLYCITSLWFLYALVPNSDNVQVVWGSDGSVFPSKDAIEDVVLKNIGSNVRTQFSRYVFIENKDTEVLVGIPTIKNQVRAVEELQLAGWNTIHRIGPITYAAKGDTSILDNPRTISSFAKELWLYFAKSNHPVHPTAIAYVSADYHPFFNKESSLVLTDENRAYELYGQLDQSLSPNMTRQVITSTDDSHLLDMYLDIPVEVVRKNNLLLKSQIESEISELLGFTETKMQLFSPGNSLSRLIIARKGNDVALGIPSNEGNSFFERELMKEYGYNHPEQKAFRLPDGTIGYELVAGNGQFNVEALPTDPSCVVVHQSQKDIFLCNRGQLTTLATSLDLIAMTDAMYQAQISDYEVSIGAIYSNLQSYIGSLNRLKLQVKDDSFVVLIENGSK